MMNRIEIRGTCRASTTSRKSVSAARRLAPSTSELTNPSSLGLGGAALSFFLACAASTAAPAAPRVIATPPAVTSCQISDAAETGPTSTPRVASLNELSMLDMSARLGSYRARDARWASGQPLLIGRDYDFSLAAADDISGPGLAAVRRKQGNLATAQRFAAFEPIAPTSLFEELIAECQDECGLDRASRAAIYGIFYGSKKPRLLVTLELSLPDATALHTAVGEERPADSFAEPGALRRAFSQGVKAIAGNLRAHGLAPPAPEMPVGASHGRCSVGDAASVRGPVVAQTSTHRAIGALRTDFIERVYCPQEAFSPAPHHIQTPGEAAPGLSGGAEISTRARGQD